MPEEEDDLPQAAGFARLPFFAVASDSRSSFLPTIPVELFSRDLTADQAGQAKHGIVGRRTTLSGAILRVAVDLDPDSVSPRCHRPRSSAPEVCEIDESPIDGSGKDQPGTDAVVGKGSVQIGRYG